MDLEKPIKSVKLAVILPAYMEGEHIYANLVRVSKTLKDHNYEIIVVNDGSQDNTLSECQRAAQDGYPIQVIHQKINRGKGATLFHGFEYASGDLIAFLDADLEIDPDNILHLWEVMKDKDADVVAGVKDPIENRFPFLRRLMSIIYRLSISFLFGLSISDTQTGIKLFKRSVLEATIPRLTISRFAFDIELLVAASRFGYRIVEQPVKITYHRAGSFGRMNIRNIFGTFIDTLAIYYRASFWRWLEPSVGTRLWMVIFTLGIFLFGVGVGKIMTPIIFNPPISQIFHIIALQFLPTTLRDWLLVISGIVMIIVSLIELNKTLLKAFVRRDRGDLAGIFRR